MLLYLPHLFISNNMHLYVLMCLRPSPNVSIYIYYYIQAYHIVTSTFPPCMSIFHSSTATCIWWYIIDGHNHHNRKDVHVEFQVTN